MDDLAREVMRKGIKDLRVGRIRVESSFKQAVFPFGDDSSGAIFSSDRQYRYALHRIWDKKLPLIAFIGLNPSTANETKSDATITRVIGYAKSWGYGGVYMLNLFAIVSTDPRVLKTHPDPLGDNDRYLAEIAPKCERIIFAWGGFKEAHKRASEIIKRYPDGYALFINSDGTPHHPLRLRADVVPVKFNNPKEI